MNAVTALGAHFCCCSPALRGGGNLLTSYNGKNITYDAIGNPLNDGSWAYTWEHGRQVARMNSGTTTLDFECGPGKPDMLLRAF